MLGLKGTLLCLLGCLLLGLTTVTVEAAKEKGGPKCSDGMDNDGDGQVDCDDPDCHGQSLCEAGNCSDGADNDDNGQVDCDDPACAQDSSCVGGGTFTATAIVTQIFAHGCIREDNYKLEECTSSDIDPRCTVVTWQSLGPNTDCDGWSEPVLLTDPLAPGEVQTQLWDISFSDTYEVVASETTAVSFNTREFDITNNNLRFGSFTLHTNDYPQKKPNNLGAGVCASVEGPDNVQRTTANPALPLLPSGTIKIICNLNYTTTPNLNLRRNGRTLDQHPLNVGGAEGMDQFIVEVTRDP